jgi:hypothetical protein
MRTRVFLALNVAGTVAVVIALRLFAQQLDGPVGAISDFNDRYSKWLTVATTILVLAVVLRQRRRGESELQVIRLLDQTAADKEEASGAAG